MTSLGVTEEVEFEVETEDPGLEQFLDSMRQSMNQLTIPFPTEPVGVGARWKTLKRITGPMMTVYQVESIELLRRVGPSVTLATTSEQLIPKQVMVLPGTPPELASGVAAEITGSGWGTFEMTVDLNSPVPRSQGSFESMIAVTVRTGDEVEESVANISMQLEVEPGQAR